MKTLIIDRFEGEYAVCETEQGTFADISVLALPEEADEGDVIYISVDKSQSEKRRQHINRLADRLFKD